MPDLTVSGTPITDALRALGVQGDGLSGESSFGTWEASTNLVTNGGFETNTTGWSAGSRFTIARSTEQAKFGGASCKATVAITDAGTGWGSAFRGLTITDVDHTQSVWIYVPSSWTGGAIRLEVADLTGVSGTTTTAANLALRDQWQRLSHTFNPDAADLLSTLRVVADNVKIGEFFYLDGWQVEAQPLATPYIHTDGATATRTAARVQAPASLLDETQGWVAMRVRIPWASASASTFFPGANPRFWYWGDDSNNRLGIFAQAGATDRLGFHRFASGAGGVRTVPCSWAAGDIVTIIARWTATVIGLSFNGAAFTDSANTSVPTFAASVTEIGTYIDGSQHGDIDVLWFACGTGTLTDQDAATIHAFGNTDKAPEDFNAAAPAAATTMTWAADTAAYLDEAFTILDPDATGASRGLLPHLRVDIDFTNDPTNATRVWTDVTADVRGDIRLTRGGRNHVLQRSEAGTLSLVLDNRAADYDPTNASSPHYPGVKRRRWMRVRGRIGVTDIPRWKGLIEGIRQHWPGAGHDATVEITASDATKVLALFDLEGLSYSSETTGTRIGHVLDDAGVTAYDLDTGQTTIVAAAAFAQGVSALSHLQQVEESENGILFAAGDGQIIFQDRHYRLLNSGTSLATIGDNDGEIPYREAELDLGDDDLWTIVSVTPDGGSPQTVTDAAAVDAHYETRLSRTILSSSAIEAQSAAEWLLQRFADSSPRVPSVELIGQRDPTTWPTILAAENSDRFTWTRRADAHTLEMDVFVERVADVISLNDWRVLLDLSPAEDQVGWVLGDPVYGLLGETTVLTY